MCLSCGCGKKGRSHKHSHTHDGHTHSHDHDHAHDHKHDHEHHHEHKHEKKIIKLERKILSRNEEIAGQNRRWLAERGVIAINLISSPGSGKTLLLESTLKRLKGSIKCAVITGDLKTDNDAKRLMNKGAKVHQIETVSACHLDAEQISKVLPKVVSKGTKLLFIENVGNLVCPAAFELGENFKVGLLSTTEGEDKPVKYPTLFNVTPIVIITKADLIPHLDWDGKKCRDYLHQTRPGVYIFELSAKTGKGMDVWIKYLQNLVQ